MVREDYYQAFTSALAEIHDLSDALINALRPLANERSYRKNQCILNVGDEQQSIYFLIAGYAREITPSEEQRNGQTTWFWFAGDFIFHNGFFSKQSSDIDIEIYHDTTVVEISYENLLLLMPKFPEVFILGEKLRMYYDRFRKQHTSDLVSIRRWEHFELFYLRNRSLFNIARHRDIASFLGIRNHGLNRYFKNQ
ncbi:Crp/Fnr family transcriptional regulator [Pedobacter jeongneungensis]|uniref:Crp/Fnr family transcriptional regulator n=1 Tax=Pedobacter jeongneungensis TaxID=947309 RepID=UPI00046A437F|nr:Crp/Fnr family transcriptional regulator [Pedobacter jeongneungensis]